MTRPPKHLLHWIVLVVACVMLLVPRTQARNYLLFGAPDSDTHGYVYQMDSAGNLKLRVEPKVTYDCYRIGVAPDGNTVVYSGFTTPTLTVFHIGQDGSLTPPVAVNGRAESWTNSVVFHPSLPIFYISTASGISSYRYDWAIGTVTPANECKKISSTSIGKLAYSAYNKRLIYTDAITYGRRDGLGTVPLMKDGALSAPGPELKLPESVNEGFAVSPDGRWAVDASMTGLYLVAVGQDGALNLADSRDFSPDYHMGGKSFLGFSPDGRFIYYFNNSLYFLVCFEIDSQTGHLIEHSYLSMADMPVDVSLINAFAITTDGHFAAFCTPHPTRWSENYNMIHIVHLDGNGGMEYLDGKQMDVPQYLNALAFAPLPDTAAGAQWELYE